MKLITIKLTPAEAHALELMAEEGAQNVEDVLDGQDKCGEDDVFSALDKLRTAIAKAGAA